MLKNILEYKVERSVLVALLMLALNSLIYQPVRANPVVLSELQLDSVAAGYVNIYGNATAEAVGAIARAGTHVEFAQTRVEDAKEGVAYTYSTVIASASAIGEVVRTTVSAGFDTDESIVSLDIDYTAVRGATTSKRPGQRRAHRKGKDKKRRNARKNRKRAGKPHRKVSNRGKHKRRIPLVYQNKSVTLTLVTSQRL